MNNSFDVVKEALNFERVASDCGVYFKNNKVLCIDPDHEEKTPSMHNHGTHAYCYGCGKRFSVIDIIMCIKGLSAVDSMLYLAERYNIKLPEYSKQDKEQIDKRSFGLLVLRKLVEYANGKIKEYPDVLKFLKKKGMNQDVIDKYLIGYYGNEDPIRNNLLKLNAREIAICNVLGLSSHGRPDTFRNRILIPTWHYEKIIFLSGRIFPPEIVKGSKLKKFLHLPASELTPNKPMAFRENLTRDKCIIVESITDAIAIIESGVPATALQGIYPGEKEIKKLQQAKAKLFILLDSDKAGTDEELRKAKEFRAYIANLGAKEDPDEILGKIGKEKFKALIEKTIKEAKYFLDVMIDGIEKEENRMEKAEQLDEVMQILIGMNLSASNETAFLKYISKKLRGFTDLKTLNKIRDDNLAKKRILEDEKTKDDDEEKYADEEISKAKILLKSPDILGKLTNLTERAGFVGESENQRMVFLSGTSRIVNESNSIIVKGLSSTGKNALVEKIFRAFPEKDIMSYSFITGKALVHMPEGTDLSHKILFVAEAKGGEQSEYAIRTSISEREISILIPIKDPDTGNWITIEKRVKAVGMVFIQTTTKSRVHAENQNRVFDVYMDESKQQTDRILTKQAERFETFDLKENEIEAEFKIFRCMQTLLKPYNVVIPYALKIKKVFPLRKARERRDYFRFISLLQSHCLTYQFQREHRGEDTLIANAQDLRAVIEIASNSLIQSLQELTPNELYLLEAIYESDDLHTTEDGEEGFTLKTIADLVRKRIKYRTVSWILKHFWKEGLIHWNNEKSSKSRYCKKDDTTFEELMQDREDIPDLLEAIVDELEGKGETEDQDENKVEFTTIEEGDD